jgi:FKBP-type peptidyl-prolyl cis-trans isomerase 2
MQAFGVVHLLDALATSGRCLLKGLLLLQGHLLLFPGFEEPFGFGMACGGHADLNTHPQQAFGRGTARLVDAAIRMMNASRLHLTGGSGLFQSA